MAWTVALVVLAFLSAIVSAQSIDGLVAQLTAQSTPCTMPASFSRIDSSVSYQGRPTVGGTSVDSRNVVRPVDFDGDGVCEVLAETCGPSTGVRNGEALMCPDAWLVPLKFKGGIWQAAYDIGTGGGVERWRGAATFLYFDPNTGRLRLSAMHNFFANESAQPALVVSLYEQGKGQVRQFDYDVFSEAGTAQQGGVLQTFLAMHAKRLMDEYEWRLDNCGGTAGYRDPDSQSARLDDLGDMLRQLLTAADIAASAASGAGGDGAGASWQRRVQQLLDERAPTALMKCKPPRGYKDIVNSPSQRE